MAELVSSILLSQYFNESNGAAADEALQQHVLDQHALEDDAGRQRRVPLTPFGEDTRPRLRRSVYRRGPRAITFHVLGDGAGASAQLGSHLEPVEGCGPIMRRASWVEEPFPGSDVLASGFGLPRTPLRVLSIGASYRNLSQQHQHQQADPPRQEHQNPLPQRPLSHQQLELGGGGGGGQDMGGLSAAAVEAATRGSLQTQALARTMRGAWGPMQSLRGRTAGAGAAWAHGHFSAGPSPLSPWQQQLLLLSGDGGGLATPRPPSDATAVISIVGDPHIGGDFPSSDGGGVNGFDSIAGWRQVPYSNMAARPVSAMPAAAADAAAAAAAHAAANGRGSAVRDAGVLLQSDGAAAAAASAAATSGAAACAVATTPGPAVAPASSSAPECSISSAAAAVANILWPLRDVGVAGGATLLTVGPGQAVCGSGGVAMSYSPVHEADVAAGEGGAQGTSAVLRRRPYSAHLGLLPGQVVGSADGTAAVAAAAAAAEEADRRLSEEAEFLMPKSKNSRTLSRAVSKELDWWIMSSQDYGNDGLGKCGTPRGGLRRRRRHWQRTSSSGGAADGAPGGSDWSAVTAAAAVAAARSGVSGVSGRACADLSAAATPRQRRRGWRFSSWRLHLRLSAHDIWSRLDGFLPVLLPSRRRDCWDGVLLVLLVYTAAVVPLEAGFQGIHAPALDAVDWLILGMFWVDIFVQFRSAYISESGELVRETAHIAQHYCRTWLPVDLASSLPWSEVLRAALAGRNPHLAALMTLLRLIRLLKLVRLLQFLDRFRYANFLRLGRLFVLMIFVAHWTCCAWHGLSEWLSGWPWLFDTLRNQGDGGSVASEYSLAIYSSFVLVVGSDNLSAQNNVERVFFICMLIVGAIIYALIVGNMAVLAANLNALSTRYKAKSAVVVDALRYMGAPQHFRDRVCAYYDFLAQHEHPGPEADAFLSELPRGLSEDIKWCLFSGPFYHLSLFSGCDEPFMAALQARLILVAFTPGEEIFRAGEPGQHMYVVRQGTVLLRSEVGDLVRVVLPGESFSELALLPDLAARRHICTAVSASATDLVALASRDLALACREHPDSGALVQERLIQLLEDRIQGTEWTWFIEKVLVPCQLYDESAAAGHYPRADSGSGTGGAGGSGEQYTGGFHNVRRSGDNRNSFDVDADSRTASFVRKLQESRRGAASSFTRVSSSFNRASEQATIVTPGFADCKVFEHHLPFQMATPATATAADANAASPSTPVAAAGAGRVMTSDAPDTGPVALAVAASAAAEATTTSAHAAPPQALPMPSSPPQPPPTPTAAAAIALASVLSTPADSAAAAASAVPTAAATMTAWGLPCVPDLAPATSAAASAGQQDGVCVPCPSGTTRRLRHSASTDRHAALVTVPVSITAADATPPAVTLSPAAAGHGPQPQDAPLLLPGMAAPYAEEKLIHATAMAEVAAAPAPALPAALPRGSGPGEARSRPGSVESVASSLQLLRLGTSSSAASGGERRPSLDQVQHHHQQHPPQQQVPVRIGQFIGNGEDPRGGAGGTADADADAGMASGNSLSGRVPTAPSPQRVEEEEEQQQQQPCTGTVEPLASPSSRRELVRGGGAVPGVGSSRRFLRTVSDLLVNLMDRLRGAGGAAAPAGGEHPLGNSMRVRAVYDEADGAAAVAAAGAASPPHRLMGRRRSSHQASSYLASVTQDLTAAGAGTMPYDGAHEDHLGQSEGDVLGGTDGGCDSAGSKNGKRSLGGSLESLEAVKPLGPPPLPSPSLPYALPEASALSATVATAAADGTTMRVRHLRRSDGSKLPTRWMAAVQRIKQQQRFDGDDTAADGKDRASGSSTGSTRAAAAAAVATAAAASTFLPEGLLDESGRHGNEGGIPSLVLHRSRSRAAPARQLSIRVLSYGSGAGGSTTRRIAGAWLQNDTSDDMSGVPPPPPGLQPPRQPTTSDSQSHWPPNVVLSHPAPGLPKSHQGGPSRTDAHRAQLQASLILLAGVLRVDLTKLQAASQSPCGGAGPATVDGAAAAAPPPPPPCTAGPGSTATAAAAAAGCNWFAGGGAAGAAGMAEASSAPLSSPRPGSRSNVSMSGGVAGTPSSATGPAAPGMAEALLSQPCSRLLLLALADAVVRREGAAVPAVQELLQRHGTAVRLAVEGRFETVLGSMAEGVEAADQSMVILSDSLAAANRRLAVIERRTLEDEGVLAAGGLLRHLSRGSGTHALDQASSSDDDEDDQDGVLCGDDDGGGALLRSGGSVSGAGGGTEDFDTLAAALLRMRTPLHLSMELDPFAKSSSSGVREDDPDSMTRPHLSAGGQGGAGAGTGAGGLQGPEGRRASRLSFGPIRPLTRAVTTGAVFETSQHANALAIAASAVEGQASLAAAAPGHVRKCTSNVDEIARDRSIGCGVFASGYSTAARRRSLEVPGGGGFVAGERRRPSTIGAGGGGGGGDAGTDLAGAATAPDATAGLGSRNRRRSQRISQGSMDYPGVDGGDGTDAGGGGAAAAAAAATARTAFHSEFTFASSSGTPSGRAGQGQGQVRGSRSRRASLVLLHAANLLSADGAATAAVSSPSSPQTAGLGAVRRRASYAALLDDKVVADGVGGAGGSRHTTLHGVAPSERPGARRATTARSPGHQHAQNQPYLARSRTSTSELTNLAGAAAGTLGASNGRSNGGGGGGGGDVSVHGPSSRPAASQAGSRRASQAGSRRASRAGDSRATSRRASQSSIGCEEASTVSVPAGAVSDGGGEAAGEVRAQGR